MDFSAFVRMVAPANGASVWRWLKFLAKLIKMRLKTKCIFKTKQRLNNVE